MLEQNKTVLEFKFKDILRYCQCPPCHSTILFLKQRSTSEMSKLLLLSNSQIGDSFRSARVAIVIGGKTTLPIPFTPITQLQT